MQTMNTKKFKKFNQSRFSFSKVKFRAFERLHFPTLYGMIYVRLEARDIWYFNFLMLQNIGDKHTKVSGPKAFTN